LYTDPEMPMEYHEGDLTSPKSLSKARAKLLGTMGLLGQLMNPSSPDDEREEADELLREDAAGMRGVDPSAPVMLLQRRVEVFHDLVIGASPTVVFDMRPLWEAIRHAEMWSQTGATEHVVGYLVAIGEAEKLSGWIVRREHELADAEPPAGVDYQAVAERLRRESRAVPAALVELLWKSAGGSASYEEVAFAVHGDPEAGDEAIESNIKKTKALLRVIEPRLTIRRGARRVQMKEFL